MKRVLIAPLDWGLGHATRCIPIIRELMHHNCDIFLAGSGDSLQLLRNEFPQFPFFSLPGYKPVYPSTGSMVWKMAAQLLKFFVVIRKENRQIERIVLLKKIDLIISDNRYGCWSDRIPSVFITHQSTILMPAGFSWLANRVNNLNNWMIQRFTECWVPDSPGTYSLAGTLTTGRDKGQSQSTRYIGALSRFGPPNERVEKYDIVCILSGPEPQRSIFEEIVSKQLRHSGLRYFIVRGLLSSPGKMSTVTDSSSVDFLPGEELQTLIEESKCVIARSGYSTVMDLARLGKKAIFVPTPGQTEQEYLAARFMKSKVAYAMEQNRFDLTVALTESKNYKGFRYSEDDSYLLREALDRVLTFASPDLLHSKSSISDPRLV